MLQKVLKIGNSYGVTLPSQFVAENKIKVGSKVEINCKVPGATKYKAASDHELFEIMKEVELKYGDALEELAQLK